MEDSSISSAASGYNVKEPPEEKTRIEADVHATREDGVDAGELELVLVGLDGRELRVRAGPTWTSRDVLRQSLGIVRTRLFHTWGRRDLH